MKFEDDKSLDKVEATCRPGNTWDEPVWLKCVESKIHYTIFQLTKDDFTDFLAKLCPEPPPPPEGGSAKVKKDGVLFGTNCSTGGIFETVGGAGNCEAITIKQISSEYPVSTYQLGLENSLKGERKAAVMILTFSRGSFPNYTYLNFTGEV